MKSEKCKLNGTSACAETALNETERFAKACGLPAKKALHLRLLAEETLGMMNGLLAVRDGEFWVESNKHYKHDRECCRTSVGGFYQRRK